MSQMMGAREPTVMEETVVLMEDIFVGLHSVGQQVNIGSQEVVEGERFVPELSVVEEIVIHRGQEEM